MKNREKERDAMAEPPETKRERERERERERDNGEERKINLEPNPVCDVQSLSPRTKF